MTDGYLRSFYNVCHNAFKIPLYGEECSVAELQECKNILHDFQKGLPDSIPEKEWLKAFISMFSFAEHITGKEKRQEYLLGLRTLLKKTITD